VKNEFPVKIMQPRVSSAIQAGCFTKKPELYLGMIDKEHLEIHPCIPYQNSRKCKKYADVKKAGDVFLVLAAKLGEHCTRLVCLNGLS